MKMHCWIIINCIYNQLKRWLITGTIRVRILLSLCKAIPCFLSTSCGEHLFIKIVYRCWVVLELGTNIDQFQYQSKRNLNYVGKAKLLSADSEKSIGEIAIRSLCELYTSTTHFNFHLNVSVLLVKVGAFSRQVIMLYSIWVFARVYQDLSNNSTSQLQRNALTWLKLPCLKL